MGRVVHFELQADDCQRAMKFYGDVFGWKFDDWSGVTGSEYWGIITGEEGTPGINGGLLKRPCPPPASEQGTNAFTCTVQIEDYDAVEKKILAAGGKVVLPKYALMGMAWQGYYLDTEGNVFGLHQPDKNAK